MVGPKEASTCKSKGPKDVWIERTSDHVVASGSLKGKILQMEVVEDFEPRPHKAVPFVVRREKDKEGAVDEDGEERIRGDVCDEKATVEDGSVSQHSGLSCGQRDLFSAFASGHRRPVALEKCVCGSIVWPARLQFSLSFRHLRSLIFFCVMSVWHVPP